MVVLAFVPALANAQGNDVEPEDRVTLGPVGVKPTIFWNTEYDDNLFRTNVPVSDIVSTIGFNTDIQGSARRVNVSARGSADWVHYAKFVNQRGANVAGSLRLDFQLNRFVPYASTSYINTRQRLNPELDTRPRVEESTFALGGLIHVGGKTAIDLSASRGTTGYAQGTDGDDALVGYALNRESNHVAVKLLQEITPLTRINVTGEVQRNRFDQSSRRNADNARLTAGFESSGRLNGHIRAGLRILKPEDPSLSESRGLYLSVATNATLKDRLQLGVDAERDVAPSYRFGAAYYEFYTYGGSITCAVLRSLRLTMLVSRRVADYPATLGTPVSTLYGTDRETKYGSGLRYQLGESMAIDLTGAFTNRTSTLASRQFDSLSLKAGVSHAF
jgi:hypothetical protein